MSPSLTPLPPKLSTPIMTTPFVRISDLHAHDGAAVAVRGRVTHVRSSGKVAFVVLRDGSGIIQCVIVKTAAEARVWDRYIELTVETSVGRSGTVRADGWATGGYELSVTGLEVIG